MDPFFLYIDPGAGSILFQIIIAGVLGVLFFFRAAFERVKSFSVLISGRFASFLKTRGAHPFLIAVFFVLHYTKEVLILYPLLKVVIFTASIMAASALVYLTLFLATKRNHLKSAILLSAFLLPTLFYESLYGYLSGLTHLAATGYLILLLFLIATSLVWFTKKNLSNFNAYLNVLFMLLVLFEGSEAIYHYIKNSPNANFADTKKELVTPAPDYQAPVIYHILLDAYTSSSSLKKYWNYDNHELEDFLKSSGFYIATNAHSNSTATQQSMATTFNMSLLPDLDSTFTNDLLSTSAYRNYIDHSRIFNELSARNYRFINLSIFDIADHKRFHNIGILADATDLFHLLARNTRFALPVRQFPYIDHKTILAVFDSLQKLPATSDTNKVFIYAHVNLPHSFYFDRNGNIYNDSMGPFPGDGKKNYLENVMYANSLLMTTVKKILADSKTPPVIIIHGDHGFRMIGKEESHTIFSAYYFPDKDYHLLYDSISPVNTYRIILKKYFNENIRLLPDKKYPDSGSKNN